MYSLPKEISLIMKKIEDKGFNVYVTGGSIRDLMIGADPEDWDLSTDASPEEVSSILGAGVIESPGAEYGVLRVKEGELEAEIASLRQDGEYSDKRRPDGVSFTKNLEVDLARRDFTINAMAFHPQKGIVDPFDGRKDIKEKLIRSVGNPQEKLEEDPLRILRGIRLAGQLDFDIQLDTFTAMQKNVCLLAQVSMDRKRAELERLLVTKNTGKALRMMLSAGAMEAVFDDCFPIKKNVENGDLETLVHNIDRARKDVDLRLSLLLLCFEKSKAKRMIEDLNLSKKRKAKQLAAQDHLTDIYFCTDKYALKRFIYRHSWDIYDYLNDLSKQQRDVYDTPGYRVESRYYLLEDMKKYKEPVFMEDLAIKAKDLIDAGIVPAEKADEMMGFLVDVIHRFPGLNTKEKLLKKAKSLKNPIRAKFRNIYMVK